MNWSKPGANSISGFLGFEVRFALVEVLGGFMKLVYRVKGVDGFFWLSELIIASQMMACEGGSEAILDG